MIMIGCTFITLNTLQIFHLHHPFNWKWSVIFLSHWEQPVSVFKDDSMRFLDTSTGIKETIRLNLMENFPTGKFVWCSHMCQKFGFFVFERLLRICHVPNFLRWFGCGNIWEEECRITILANSWLISISFTGV